MKASELPLYWASSFFRTLNKNGVNQAVISPGSRSAPLTLSLAALSGFKKYTIVDERSAAFTALGIAKYTSKPVVLVCTSGTAAANYYPAVIEARQSGIPLILLTADRPPSIQKTGASQSIDQHDMFGSYPVFSFDPGVPSENPKNISRLKTAAEQSVYFSQHRAGPVHINFPFEKPLEPDSTFFEKIRRENLEIARVEHTQKPDIIHQLTELNDTTWSEIVSAERPIIIAGPAHPHQDLSFVAKLAESLKAPVLAEPGSNILPHDHIIDGFDGFLRNKENRDYLKTDLVLRFGRQPVSKALNLFLSEIADHTYIAFHHPELWSDESLTVSKSVVLKGSLDIPEISGSASGDWLSKWEKVSAKFCTYKTSVINNNTLTDGFVFAGAEKFLSKDTWVMLSNSFPVRDMQLFNKYHKPCFVNRGAAGIDGITSTAIGLSLANNTPGVLFTGDLAFLHDLNALQQTSYVEAPLMIIVLNNGGGTIFRMLPVFDELNKDIYTTYFETPQRISLVHLCRAHNVDHTLVTRTHELDDAISNNIHKSGVHVIECITDADDSMKQRKKLWNFEVR